MMDDFLIVLPLSQMIERNVVKSMYVLPSIRNTMKQLQSKCCHCDNTDLNRVMLLRDCQSWLSVVVVISTGLQPAARYVMLPAEATSSLLCHTKVKST